MNMTAKTSGLKSDDLIVITGAGGFIAGSLARYFREQGFTRIRAVDKKPLPQWYQVPVFYFSNPACVLGPDEPVAAPQGSQALDYELELACVIGRPGRDIAASDALDHVFGWTLWNDLSARDTQARELPLGMGPGKAKDWDGANVLGPCLVTADEVDGTDLELVLRVNGEERTRARSSQMHHDWGALVAYASQACTLHPGEVLGSGTVPGGAGVESGRLLAPGDLVELEGAGIGVLANRIGPRP